MIRKIKKIKKIKPLQWLAILSISSILLLANFQVNSFGHLSTREIELQFDHEVTISELKQLASDNNLNLINWRILGSNIAQLNVNNSIEDSQKFVEKLADNKSILESKSYQKDMFNPISTYSTVAIAVMVTTMLLSLLAFYLFKKDESKIQRLKLWALFNTINILIFTVTAAIGIILTKLNLEYNEQVFRLYVVSVLCLLLVNTYVFSQEQTREELRKILKIS